MSDAKGALVRLAQMPRAKRLLGDKGHNADWLRDEPNARGVRVCLPARSKRKRPAPHNRKLYQKRCRIEHAFAWLKDRRGVALRTPRCGDLSLFAIAPPPPSFLGCCGASGGYNARCCGQSGSLGG